jgi:hypothetical protein
MTQYIRLVKQPSADPRERFWRARRDANLALLAWLNEQPDPTDVAAEVDGSISVLRQLAKVGKAVNHG